MNHIKIEDRDDEHSGMLLIETDNNSSALWIKISETYESASVVITRKEQVRLRDFLNEVIYKEDNSSE